MTDAGGTVVFQNIFDTAGRVVSQTNARGFTATFTYDTPTAGTTTNSKVIRYALH
jgi:hypothetical protein